LLKQQQQQQLAIVIVKDKFAAIVR